MRFTTVDLHTLLWAIALAKHHETDSLAHFQSIPTDTPENAEARKILIESSATKLRVLEGLRVKIDSLFYQPKMHDSEVR